jgi:hypothetical protein
MLFDRSNWTTLRTKCLIFGIGFKNRNVGKELLATTVPMTGLGHLRPGPDSALQIAPIDLDRTCNQQPFSEVSTAVLVDMLRAERLGIFSTLRNKETSCRSSRKS